MSWQLGQSGFLLDGSRVRDIRTVPNFLSRSRAVGGAIGDDVKILFHSLLRTMHVVWGWRGSDDNVNMMD